jgi:hypothetical protein
MVLEAFKGRMCGSRFEQLRSTAKRAPEQALRRKKTRPDQRSELYAKRNDLSPTTISRAQGRLPKSPGICNVNLRLGLGPAFAVSALSAAENNLSNCNGTESTQKPTAEKKTGT